MQRLALLVVLSLLSFTGSPLAGQAIPDWIPDQPGESPADRAQERLEERFRGTISRFFTTGGFDLAPFPGEGSTYQANVSLGMSFSSGDAVFLFASSRELVGDGSGAESTLHGSATAWYGGVGYQISALRFVEPSELARRSSLNVGAGLIKVGELEGGVLEVAPTYHLVEGRSWSLPVGLKLSLAALGSETGTATTDAFVGLSLGIRHHFGERQKLRSRYDADDGATEPSAHRPQ